MSVLGVLLFCLVLVNSQTVNWDLIAGQIPDATVAQQIKPLSVNSTGSCSLTLKYDIAGTLSGVLTCTGLTSPVTSAHIHCSAASTDLVNGDFPVAYDTGINDTLSSPYTFSNALDATNAGLLCSDKCYFNVHTKNNSGGEVRLNLVGFTGVCGTGKVFSGAGAIGSELSTYGVAPAGQMPSWTIQAVYGATGGCSAWVSYTTGAPGSLTVAGWCKTLTGTKISGVNVQYNATTTDINFITTGTIGSTVPYSYTKTWTDTQRDDLCNTRGESVDAKKFSIVIETDTQPMGEATGVLTFTTACPTVTVTPTAPPSTPSSGFTYSVTILLLVFSTLTSFFW